MITPKVYIDFERDGSWTDVSAYIETVGTLGGMSVVDQRIADIGTCVLRAINTDRRWSPDNAAGPYYPYLLPLRPVKVEATDGSTTWPIWRGYTTSITPDADQYGVLYATIECADILHLFQTYGITIPVQENILPGDLVRVVTSTALKAPRATGYLEFSGVPDDGDTVTIGAMTYRFVAALAQANDVLLGQSVAETMDNLVAAIHRDDGSGTLYHAATERHPRVTAATDGETLDIPTAGVAQGFAVGRWPDNDNLYYTGQSFTLTIGGGLDVFSLWFGNRGGSPVGTMTWKIFVFDPDAGETVGAALETGTFTPVTPEPAWNTIPPAGTTYLEPGVYKLELEPTVDQASGDYWNVLASDGAAGDVYEGGTFWQLQADPLDEWGEWVGQDLTMTLTCSATRVMLTATVRGAWGNDIALSSTSGVVSASDTTLTGGVDYPAGLLDTEDGQRVISLAGEDWSEDTNALAALGEIARAEFGLLWVARDGTITFRDQQYTFLKANDAPDMVLDDDHEVQFATLSIDNVKNRIVVTYTPYAELEGVVVARAQEPIRVLSTRKKAYKRWNPSDDVTAERGLSVVRLKYVDVDTGQIAAATDIQQPLVPGSDYRVFPGALGAGVDRSGEGWIEFALALTGSGIEVHMTNTQNRHLWVHDLQVRGTALVKYDPITVIVEDIDSQDSYGQRELPFDIPLLSGNIRDYATLLGQYLLSHYKDPFLRVGVVGFRGVESVGGQSVFGIEIGDIIQASETQTGIVDQTFLVIGVQYALASGQVPQALLYLARLDDIPYGIYDDPELGVYNQTHYAL